MYFTNKDKNELIELLKTRYTTLDSINNEVDLQVAKKMVEVIGLIELKLSNKG